jgi:hypothetical protein
LIWGESKIYQQLPTALDAVCKSIADFLTEQDGRAGRDRDIDIITEYMDIENPKLREALLNYFDPYSEESNFREEAYACFVGFDYREYSNIEAMSKDEREEFFKAKYLERVESACNLFGEKIKTNNLSHLKINLFLIPFPSIEQFRTKFFSGLGVEV